MAFVGHSHMFEYANMGYKDKIRFPGKKHGPVIDNCDKAQKEIMNTKSRTQNFTKGKILHEFMVGGSGTKFRTLCPYHDQDGKVYFQNVKEHGMMAVEVNSKKFVAKYYEGVDNLVYEIIINA